MVGMCALSVSEPIYSALIRNIMDSEIYCSCSHSQCADFAAFDGGGGSLANHPAGHSSTVQMSDDDDKIV